MPEKYLFMILFSLSCLGFCRAYLVQAYYAAKAETGIMRSFVPRLLFIKALILFQIYLLDEVIRPDFFSFHGLNLLFLYLLLLLLLPLYGFSVKEYNSNSIIDRLIERKLWIRGSWSVLIRNRSIKQLFREMLHLLCFITLLWSLLFFLIDYGALPNATALILVALLLLFNMIYEVAVRKAKARMSGETDQDGSA